MSSLSVFVIDDDRSFLRVLSYQVQEMGFEVSAFESPVAALERLKSGDADVVITDLVMPEMNGLDLLEEIATIDLAIPVIVLTAHGSINLAVEATRRGAFEFLTKPFEKEQLEQVIRNALNLSNLVRENQRLNQAIQDRFKFDGIIGTSGRFREVLRLAEQLAELDTTVLIQGESGTGKELVARAIHYNSPRRNRPFVVINCGAIPKDLMESELFGYRKGAFTGASTDRKGKFETADSGTVFLDEIGELPLNMQVKLLRVLQQKEIDVVGDPRPRPVDVRIIAATNRNLLEMVQQHDFREDLYYRLSVVPLNLPPLRDRYEDIPLLAHHFLQKYQAKLGKTVQLAPEVMEALQGYEWPGNVRELENVMERMVVFARKPLIGLRDLPAMLRVRSIRSLGDVIIHLPEKGFSLEGLEKDILRSALEMHNWNQTRAAAYLRLTRNTLIYRMHKFGLRPEKVTG